VRTIRGFFIARAQLPLHFRTIATNDITPTARPTQSDDTLPRPPPPPFDIETMEPIEPPWQAIK
jgi:hypothetical protein